MSKIDCRGKACPQPVLMAKQALETIKKEEFTLIVDNPSSCENVERFVRSQGGSVEVERREQDFYLHIQKKKNRDESTLSSASLPPLQRQAMNPADTGQGLTQSNGSPLPEKEEKVVVYLNSHLLGVGDEALGSILMRSFLKTLLDLDTKCFRLILINSGVRLASEGSEVLETLKALSEEGVEILSCGTCLDFYGLKEKVRVGVVSNMVEIAQSLLKADRLVRP